MKILIIGYLPADINQYVARAKVYGVKEKDLVFMTNNFDASKISNKVYSDVIISKLPHQFKGVHGKNIITHIKQNPSKYPKLHTSCIDGGALKPLSITMFESYLKDSEYFRIYGLGSKKIAVKATNKKVKAKVVVKESKAPRKGTTYQNWLKSH